MDRELTYEELALRVRKLEQEAVGCELHWQTIPELTRLAAMAAEIGRALVGEEELATALHQCAEAMVRNLGVHLSHIWTFADDGDTLDLRACAGCCKHTAKEHLRIRPPRDRIRSIMIRGCHDVTNTAIADAVVADKDWLEQVGLTTHVCLPLVVAGRGLGVVTLFSKTPLNDRVADALTVVADQIALGIKRHETEEALRASEAQYRLLHESMMDAFVETDMEGKILETNRVFQEMLGYSEEELSVLAVASITPRKWHKLDAGVIAEQILQHGHSDVYEKEYRRKDGTVFPVELRVSLLRNQRKQPIAMWAIVRDVTAHRQAEDEIRNLNVDLERRVRLRTAELAAANRELESFAYSVSHDLRAPLRAIAGFSSIVSSRHRSRLDEEGRHYVDNIVLAGERMGRLIDDLLEYSRLGRRAIQKQAVNPGDILGHVTSHMAARIEETGAVLNIPNDMPAVFGDVTLLTQIFTNLLDNALTYCSADGPPRITVTCREGTDHLLFCIADNGIGIDPQYHEKVFNVFQRLHGDDDYPGTGIGLSIVKRSAELLGGEVGVDSVPDRGSNFWVKLPRDP